MTDPFAEFENLRFIGELKTLDSREITTSHFGVGFECLDRNMWDTKQAWPVLSALGIKWARVQTGWARTETVCGEYQFAWLDDTVDRLIDHGVNPWLSLSYGNPLYTKELDGAVHGAPPKIIQCDSQGVGFPPIGTPEAMAGWLNYVRATVRHYKNRVTHFEVWNEPDLLSFWKCQPRAADYARFVRETAKAIRAENPNARVIGGAIAWGMTVWSLKFLEDCFRAGMHEDIDILTYHGYKSVPERHSTQEIAAFTHLIRRYKPSLEFWQGEAGVQSHVPEGAAGMGALSTMKSSEDIQARMLLRRFLLEMNNGCSMTSYFHMADFTHYGLKCTKTFHYGLLRLEDGSPKPAYKALQVLATLLCDPVEPAEGRSACHLSLLKDTEDPRATKAHTWHANFLRGDVPVHAWWIPDSVEDDPVVVRGEMTYYLEHGLKLDDPVLIDPRTGRVYALEMAHDRRCCGETWMFDDPQAEGLRVFRPLPVSSSPLLLTDRSILKLC